MQAVYQKMGDAGIRKDSFTYSEYAGPVSFGVTLQNLLASDRAIVFSLGQYGLADVWKWEPECPAICGARRAILATQGIP
jgi:hypothetical protein